MVNQSYIKLAGENWLVTKRCETLVLSFHHVNFMLPSSASVCDIIARSFKTRIYKQIYKHSLYWPLLFLSSGNFYTKSILNLRQI